MLCSFVEPTAEVLKLLKYYAFQFTFLLNFAYSMFLDVIIWGQKQIDKIYVSAVISRQWFHNFAKRPYSMHSHSHKTLCFIKHSHVTCASEGKQ